MSKWTKKSLREYEMLRERLGMTDQDMSLCLNRARRHHHMQEQYCSPPRYLTMGEDSEKRYEQWEKVLDGKVERCEKRLTNQLLATGRVSRVIFEGDPRGCTVKVLLSDGSSGDSWSCDPDTQQRYLCIWVD